MKQTILFFILISGFAFGQFKITESSNDWQKIGNFDNTTILYKKGDLAKLEFVDIRNNKGFSRNNSKILEAIEDGNNGVKYGFYEFQFSAKDDTLEKLYSLIIDHFKSKTKEELILNFPEGDLYVKFENVVMFYTVSFGIKSGRPDVYDQKIYSQPFQKNGINKLFGKNK